MPETPTAQAEIPKFEFELGKAPDNAIYWVVNGGRAALKCFEWPQTGQYRNANHGIIDEGSLRMLLQENGASLSKDALSASVRESNYSLAHGYLQRCRETAKALMGKYEFWGVHIDNILPFYEAVRAQSDQIIDTFLAYHPEFKEFRLPPISETDTRLMQQMARVALKAALTRIK
jgi:hypothetical protein